MRRAWSYMMGREFKRTYLAVLGFLTGVVANSILRGDDDTASYLAGLLLFLWIFAVPYVTYSIERPLSQDCEHRNVRIIRKMHSDGTELQTWSCDDCGGFSEE